MLFRYIALLAFFLVGCCFQIFASPVAPTPNEVKLGEITGTSFQFKGEIVDLQWQSDTTGTIVALSDSGKALRSTDDGKTWTEPITTSLTESSSNQVIEKIVKSPIDPLLMFLIGKGKTSFISDDGGATWQTTVTPFHLLQVKLNPTHSHKKHILAIGRTDKCQFRESNSSGTCHKQLYYSPDWGVSWKLLTTYIVQADWLSSCENKSSAELDTFHSSRISSSHIPPTPLSILATKHTKKHGHQRFSTWDASVSLVRTDDLFKKEKTLMKGGNRFLMSDKYLFIAKVEPHLHGQVLLHLTSDCANSFYSGIMPFRLRQHSYTVLDTAEDQVILHVNHAGPRSKFGNVYISDAIGLNYTLSLKHNVRDENGMCDFERVRGLEGIYLANYVSNAKDILRWEEVNDDSVEGGLASGTATQANRRRALLGAQKKVLGKKKSVSIASKRPNEKIRTVITFDKGATWDAIPAPNKDAKGNVYMCAKRTGKKKSCNLHLHGVTSRWGPMYSTESATGIILATGNVGPWLSDTESEVNTYLSRDGGKEWYEVRKGSRIYEIGNHGGLIVMADNLRATKVLEYSWDEGVTWQTYQFSSLPVSVTNIVIEPTSRGQSFLVYGTQHSMLGGSPMGTLHSVDFSTLHERVCSGSEFAGAAESDYELWSPTNGHVHGTCLLGHEMEYVRRKRQVACYNPVDQERSFFVQHCECTSNDYECDFGYYRVGGKTGPCVKDPSIKFNITKRLLPQHCPKGGLYTISNGYRKVAGDTCVGGEDLLPSVFPCPSHGLLGVSGSGWVVLVFIIALIVGMCAVTNESTTKLEMNLKAFGTTNFGDDVDGNGLFEESLQNQHNESKRRQHRRWSLRDFLDSLRMPGKPEYKKLDGYEPEESPFHYDYESQDDEEGNNDPVADLLPMDENQQPVEHVYDEQVPRLNSPPSVSCPVDL